MTIAPVSITIKPFNENTLNSGMRDLVPIRGIAKIKSLISRLNPGRIRSHPKDDRTKKRYTLSSILVDVMHFGRCMTSIVSIFEPVFNKSARKRINERELMNKNICIWLIILLLITASLYSFEANQKRFYLGGNLGVGCDVVKPQLTLSGQTTSGKIRTNPSLLSDFKFGYNVSNNLSVLLIICNDWQAPYSTIILINTNSLGCRYYLNSRLSNLFLEGSLGYGFWLYPFDVEWNKHFSGNGFSFSVGSGYSITKNTSLYFGYQFFNPSYESLIQTNLYIANFLQTYSTHSFRLTLEYSVK